jgi:hypothetical protein
LNVDIGVFDNKLLHQSRVAFASSCVQPRRSRRWATLAMTAQKTTMTGMRSLMQQRVAAARVVNNSNNKRRKGSDGNDSGQSATTTIGNNENINSLGINGSPDNGPVGLSSWLWLLVE